MLISLTTASIFKHQHTQFQLKPRKRFLGREGEGEREVKDIIISYKTFITCHIHHFLKCLANEEGVGFFFLVLRTRDLWSYQQGGV